MRISVLLDMVADCAPERVAIDGTNGALTASALRAAARARATEWRQQAPSTVAYLGGNAPAFAVSLFSAALAGQPFCPLNYRLSDTQLRTQVARLAADTPVRLVVDATMAARVSGMPGVITIEADRCATPPEGDPTPASALAQEEVDTAAPAVLLFTSGTSGEPKTAVLTHHNLSAYVLNSVDFLGAGEDEAVLASVPPYHIAAVAGLLSAVYGGRRLVQLEAFEPGRWVAAVRRHLVTHAMLVPTMLARVLDALDADGGGLPTLRHLACGGGRMPLAVIQRALTRLPSTAFANAYGLTETSSTVSVLGPDDHQRARAGDPLALRRLGSVGQPLPGIEVCVRNALGQSVGVDVPGEIHVRGEQVAGRYADRVLTDDEGWFATRDRGWIDADGYLYVDGRLDDVIVRGGENLSPGEIEDVLRQHPGVADVAVVGEPDAQWGERVVAFVVARNGEPLDAQALQAWVRTRLRSTRTPEVMHLRDALPYNDTGKLLRRVLRDELQAACPTTSTG